MTDNEPSSELRACVDIDARGRSSGHIALKSSPVARAVVWESWAAVLTSY
jgi:hypothetical protein